MTSEVTLIVLAKAPVSGQVKTRLCPPCTLTQAASLAEAALRDTLEAVAATPAARRLLALDGPLGPWLPDGFDVVPQCEGGLDERLAHAFSGVDGPALLVGMDTPQVTPDLLEQAARGLVRSPKGAVLGLSVDGGWWAIGLRRADPDAFLGIPMSTMHTGAHQLARLGALGSLPLLLLELRDVDTITDARIVAEAAPESRFASALTAVEEQIAADGYPRADPIEGR